MRYQSIRVVRPAQFDNATAQTPGSQRFAAIHAGAGIESPIWGGSFLVEPAARTGMAPTGCAVHDIKRRDSSARNDHGVAREYVPYDHRAF
jgi:hypothetical protein